MAVLAEIRAITPQPVRYVVNSHCSYPTGWLRTLEQIDALDAVTIVPGHGEPLHDKDLHGPPTDAIAPIPPS